MFMNSFTYDCFWYSIMEKKAVKLLIIEEKENTEYIFIFLKPLPAICKPSKVKKLISKFICSSVMTFKKVCAKFPIKRRVIKHCQLHNSNSKRKATVIVRIMTIVPPYFFLQVFTSFYKL